MATVKGIVRLRVAAGKASPSPAIGQALGPMGVNMMEFCRAFNDRTKDLVENIPVPVVLTAFNDRTFEFTAKTPPSTWFIKKCSNLEKGSASPNQGPIAGTITLRHIYEIAKVKKQDTSAQFIPLESLCKNLISTAKSMGIAVVNK